jgi:hypothetical protein
MEQRPADPQPGNPRWLVIAVIVMGVLIVLGVGVLAVEMGRRMFTPPRPATEARPAAPAAGGLRPQVEIALPQGARLVGSTLSGDRLVATVQLADGSQGVWIVDLATGKVLSVVRFPAAAPR